MVFTSLQSFEEEVQKIRAAWAPGTDNTTRDLCMQIPFGGNAMKGRSVDLAKRLWEVAKEWERQFQESPEPMTWAAASRWLNEKKLSQMSSPSSLTHYLFLCNLSYTNTVQDPSASKIGHLVAVMRKGAFHFLRAECLIQEGEKPSDTAKAFEEIYDAVKVALGGDGSPGWFDPRVLEHTMCKVSRMKQEGKFYGVSNTVTQNYIYKLMN